jgi:hypothetical protein
MFSSSIVEKALLCNSIILNLRRKNSSEENLTNLLMNLS